MTNWENDRAYPQIQYHSKIIQFLGYNPFFIEADTLGGQIKKYRIEKGISQKKLANILGVDETSIRAWELNIRSPLKGKLRLLEGVINK